MCKKLKKSNPFNFKVLASIFLLLTTQATLGPMAKAEEAAVQNNNVVSVDSARTNIEAMFRYLAAEIAGQRGELGISARLFYDLAQATRDPHLAERAAKIALFSQIPGIALEATKLWVELNPA